MRTELLDYVLPEHAIAQHPRAERGDAQLCVVERSSLRIDSMRRWCSMLPAGALVVVNDTKVLRARLLGHKLPGGARVELLLTGARGGESPNWPAGWGEG